jgi:hypothetical protein
MNNLHKINSTEMPEWVKRLILAFFKMNGPLELKWHYIKSKKVLWAGHYTDYETEEYWLDQRGWRPITDEVDLAEFPPKGLELILE